MNKALKIVGVALAVLVLGSMTAYSFANAPAPGTMGVWGYVAAEKNAQLVLPETQLGGKQIKLDRVVAPEGAWVVVHADDGGMPGERVGLKHVSAGESVGVVVPLKGVSSDKVIVALHADRGAPNQFDFDMNKKAESADRPFFVNGMELAKVVRVK
jgi:hypothetical protein